MNNALTLQAKVTELIGSLYSVSDMDARFRRCLIDACYELAKKHPDAPIDETLPEVAWDSAVSQWEMWKEAMLCVDEDQ